MNTNTSKSLLSYAAIIAMASSSILAPLAASAAPTQGTIGATSTGIVNIEVDKPAQAKITGLSDLTLPSYIIGDGAQTLTTTACVYSTSGAYTLITSGSEGAGHAFALTDGITAGTAPLIALHRLNYSVDWNDGGLGAISGAGTTMTAASSAANFANANLDSADCNSGTNPGPGPNARLNVNFAEADLTAISSGTFTGTLTMLVAPN